MKLLPILGFGVRNNDIQATIRLLQAVGVSNMECAAEHLPTRARPCPLTRQNFHDFKAPFIEAGINIPVVTLGGLRRDANGALPEGELDMLCSYIDFLGAEGVSVVQVFEFGQVPPGGDRNRHRESVYASYARMIKACSEAGVRMATHGFWEPHYSLTSVQSYLSLFEAIPDPANGLCLCVGSIYQAGDDPVNAIRRLGDRIHSVHLRDVQVVEGQCREILIGSGALDFCGIIRALAQIGYQGPIQCEHFANPEYEPVWSAGFLRALTLV